MAKIYRPSLERHNAPYRGVSSREDGVNFDLAVLHDLTYLERISGGNEKFDGHKQQIEGNFSSLYHEEGHVTASAPSAGKLVTQSRILNHSQPNGWTTLGGAVLTKTSNWNHWTLRGTTHQAGLTKSVSLEPGDTLVLRAKISALVGATGSQFAWGVTNMNGAGEDFDTYNTNQFIVGSGKRASQYIEKRLYSDSRQIVDVVIYAVYGTEGITTLNLTDLSLSLYEENMAKITGVDLSIKRRLDGTDDQLSFLEERILNQKGER